MQATDDLIGSIRSSDSVLQRLYPSKKTIQAQLSDVDKLYPELNDTQFTSILNELTNFNKKVVDGTRTWQDYFNGLKEGEKWQIEFVQNTDLQNVSLEDVKKGYYSARDAAIAHNNAIQQQTLSAKAGQVALKGLAIAGNMLAMWAITKVIQVATEKIHELANASEIAAEKAEGFANSVNNAFSNMSVNLSTLSGLNDEYQKLSEGVNALGENVSLSNDDYNRYKQIISQISDIMPNLTTYFNSQGEAIAFAKGNLGELNREYEMYLQSQAQKFLVYGDENGYTIQDALDSYNNNFEYDYIERNFKIKNMLGAYEIDDLPTDTIIDALKEIQNKSRKEMVEFLNDYDMDPSMVNLNSDKDYSKEIIRDLLGIRHAGFLGSAISGIPIDNILTMDDDDFTEIQLRITNYIEQLQAKVNTSMYSVRQSLLNSLYSKASYWNIKDIGIRDDIATFISSINSDVWHNLGIETDNDLQLFVSKIINGFAENKNGFSDAWNGLFDPELLELPASEYETKIQGFVNTIADYMGLDENGKKEFLLSLGIEADGVRRLNNYIGDLTRKDPTHMAELIQYTEDFTEAQIEAWLEATNGIDSVEAAIRAYEATLDSIDEDIPDPSAPISQLIDQLNTQLKPAFDSLKSAYQSIFADDDFSPDSVDISMLESIKSDIEELNNLEDVDINIDMDDFDKFAKILTDANTKEWQAQQAFDDLATAIFNATGATEGMTDESVRLVEQLLESLGVVNATEVAVQALNESKVQAVMAAYDLIDATESEYIAMLNEAEAAGITRQEVYKLMAAEIAFGNNGLSVEQKIDQLKELANAYGDTATSALATAIMNEYASGHTDADTAINNVMEQINAGLQKVDIKFSGAIKSAGSGAKSAAGSAGKDAGEAYKDALEKELNELDTRMEAGYIDFNDYIQARLDLIEDYYQKGKISADEYYSHLEKHYEKQLSGYNKVLNAVTRRYDKEIDSINEIIDGIKKQNDALEKQLDEYDSALLLILKAIID